MYWKDTGSYTPRVHLVGVVIGGDDYYVLCENCLFREGPFEDAIDAEAAVLWHEHVTTPWQDQ